MIYYRKLRLCHIYLLCGYNMETVFEIHSYLKISKHVSLVLMVPYIRHEKPHLQHNNMVSQHAYLILELAEEFDLGYTIQLQHYNKDVNILKMQPHKFFLSQFEIAYKFLYIL